MKKFLIYTLVFTLFINSIHAQAPTKQYKLTSEEYFIKAKAQKTWAWILLGAGVISIASVSSGNVSFATAGSFGVLGAASILSSIPLFFAASRNKKKGIATSVYLESNKNSNFYVLVKERPFVPTLKLKVSF